MAKPIFSIEMVALKNELENCDQETKVFIQPLLKYEAVRIALLRFNNT